MESVPFAPLIVGVTSRTRGQVPPAGLLFGPTVVPVQPVSMSATLICALRWIGLLRLSGPGAPSVDCTPP